MEAFFDLARHNMVHSQVMSAKVTDQRIWQAMMEVPRHQFVSGKWQKVCYMDRELPLGDGRFIMQPEAFGQILELARIQEKDEILDIGCASGYSSAILARLGASVVAVESDSELARMAARNLLSLGYENVAVKHGQLLAGAPENGPYDVIIINGMLSTPPAAIISQLAKGGRLVMGTQQGVPKLVLYQNVGGTVAPSEFIDGYASAL